ncbi:hypothetical protein NKI39_31270 [Mesorhizobium sp. M0664]|uniref:hypothetical protein n=1 Tax=Mesorhizobium sp. M0664 TaxID=2956982 RepID=UPI00333DB979
MMLADVIDKYLAKQRSLGMRFESAEVLLGRFCRVMDNRDINEITPEAVALFLQAVARSVPPGCCIQVLSGLYRFACGFH